MNDPIMQSFDQKTTDTIQAHLATFLDPDQKNLSAIYTNCSNIVSLYLRETPSDANPAILCRVQSGIRDMLYGDHPFTVDGIVDMIETTLKH
jgi:hypothetical protein